MNMKLELDELSRIKKLPQTQESLHDQLIKLIPFAIKLGLYDAADYLTRLTK